MDTQLIFREHAIVPFDNGDRKIWFTSANMAELLEYADEKSVNRLYTRNKDEFSTDMTRVVTVTTRNKNNELQYNKTRIFSSRGAHLLGMLAETKIAKSLRRWLLDIIEKEVQPNLSMLDLYSLKGLTISEMQNRLVKANAWSFETFGQPGSASMTIRKRHLKKIRAAEKAILQLSQIQIPDLGEFSPEETS
ncbi:BRO family protein [Pantoea dispersa]|uniref:BRO family protein n=1 Tax=Pantoea dispersa TaxID=59814 RepID=UPI0030D3F31C